jgi:small-conductance mechanosensitive channel
MIGVIVFFLSLFAVIYLEWRLWEWDTERYGPDTALNQAFFWTATLAIPIIAAVNFFYMISMIYGKINIQ